MKLLILFVLVFSAPFAAAQWEHFDGLDSGVVTSLIVNGQRIYAASNYYGFVQSADNGKTWNRVSPDTSFQGTIIYLLAVDSFLYASTYQNIYRSSDLGNTWKELPTPASFVSVRGLGVHNKKIYLSMDSIYRSTNWGDSWVTASVNVDPGHQFVSIGKNIFTVSRENGAFRSTNEGDMWYWLPVGGSFSVSGTAMHVVGTRLFMGTEAHGIYRTTNYGQTWSIAAPFLEAVTGMASYGKKMFASWSGVGGITMSLDTGKSWNQINSGLQCYDVRKIVCSDQYLFIWASDGGFWRHPLNALAVDEHSDQQVTQLSIFPNPSETTATVEFTLATPSSIDLTVFDLLDRSVLNIPRAHYPGGLTSLRIDTRSLQNGSYCIVLEAEGRRFSKILQVCK